MSKQLQNRLLHRVLHPFLVGLYFVLYGINQYETLFVTLKEVLLLTMVTTVLGGLLFYGFKLLFNNSIKAGLLATTCLIISLFYFHFYNSVNQLIDWTILTRHRYFLLLMGLLAGGLIGYILRSKKTFSVLNRYLNTLILVLIVFELLRVIWNYYQTQQWYPAIQEAYLEYEGQNFSTANIQPDVYHILLDAYTGFDALEKHWNFDNADFKNYLQNKGFYVAAHAQSNYAHTRQVVPSMMNRDYFWDLGNNEREKASAYLIALTGIRYAKTFKDFEAMGYDLVNLSIFDMLDQPGMYVHSGIPETSFSGFMLRKTILDLYFSKKRMWTHYDAARKVIAEVKQISVQKSNRPKYIYAHLMIPHYPYYFDRTGKVHPERAGKKHWDNKAHYLDQLIYTNQLIQETIDTILNNSSTPPIIIVHGDHGFRQLTNAAKDEAGYSILTALHFPTQQYNQLHDSISPVNFYRALFNAEFDAQLDILEDQQEVFRPVEREDIEILDESGY